MFTHVNCQFLLSYFSPVWLAITNFSKTFKCKLLQKSIQAVLRFLNVGGYTYRHNGRYRHLIATFTANTSNCFSQVNRSLFVRFCNHS